MKTLIRTEIRTVCSYCQRETRALWATSADRALQGYGMCDECKKLADENKLPLQILASVKRAK